MKLSVFVGSDLNKSEKHFFIFQTLESEINYCQESIKKGRRSGLLKKKV